MSVSQNLFVDNVNIDRMGAFMAIMSIGRIVEGIRVVFDDIANVRASVSQV